MQAVTPERTIEPATHPAWQTLGVLDACGRFLYCADGARDLLGVEPSALLGSALSEHLEPGDEARYACALFQCLRDGAADVNITARALDCRLRLLRASAGIAVALEACSGGRNEHCDEAAAHGQAEPRAQLQRTAEIEALLRALPDLFFRFDAEGRFLDFSAPATSMLYAPPSLFIGKWPHEVMPPALAEQMEQARRRTHATGALVTMEYELELEGRNCHFEARYVPQLAGQTTALVRDVTERHEAERALRESEARLRESQKLDAVGRLAGGVAHDFNNLLTIILGYTAAMSRHIPDGHAAAPAMNQIVRAVERATALTKQLLALSRRQPVQPTVLDVGAILGELSRMLAGVIGEHIRVTTEVGMGLAAVRADRSQFEQVLLNLVLNARDAMPRGGQLTIRARNVGDHATPEVALSILDTGEGMDDVTRRRIFEPFFTTKARGTGLGLYTVQQIVHQHGGTIEVRSERGCGTEIEVRLPSVAELPETQPVDRGAEVVGGHETVLLVEDEEPVRALLTDVLQRLGYTVLAAENGAHAIALLESDARSIDLLLTDVVMPGCSGWDVAERVTAARPGCRVLFMSGHPVDAEEGTGRRALRGDLLHKPFTPETLASVIREQLDRRER